MEKIFIAKSIIENTELKDESIAVAVALQSILNERRNEYYVSFSMLSYYLYGRHGNRQEYKFLKLGFKDLVQNGYIKIISQNEKNNEFICDLSQLKRNKTEYFVQVTSEELIKIMTLNCGDENINKYKLFKFYIYLLGSFRLDNNLKNIYKNKFAMSSMDYYTQCTNLSKPTMYKYCSILEENNIITVIRSKYYMDSNREKINIYCRYEDTDLVKDFCKRYLKYIEIDDDNNIVNMNMEISGDKKRGLAQKYNALVRGVQYSHSEVLQIFEYIYEWNKKKDYENSLNKKHGYSEYKLKDLNVFSNLLDSKEIDYITGMIDRKLNSTYFNN